MQKWLWIGVAAVVVGSVGGYAYYLLSDTVALRIALVNSISSLQDNHGETETSDAIEPLIVEGPLVDESLHCRMPEVAALPMSRVALTDGMCQAPRFDGEPGTIVRMPYADEDEGWVGRTIDPVLRILESTLPRLNLFDPAEEAENREAKPQTVEPEPMPVPDYHQQYPHCPYHGGYPYNRR